MSDLDLSVRDTECGEMANSFLYFLLCRVQNMSLVKLNMVISQDELLSAVFSATMLVSWLTACYSSSQCGESVRCLQSRPPAAIRMCW